MVQNVAIPLNTKLDLSSYGDVTCSAENVAFANKETIQYRGCLANLRSTSGVGVVTTSGANIKFVGDEVKYNNTTIPLTGNWFLKESREIPTKIPGEYTSCLFVNGEANLTYVFSKSTDNGYLTVFDEKGEEVDNLSKSTKGSFVAINKALLYIEVLDTKIILRNIDGSSLYEWNIPTLSDKLGKTISATYIDGKYIVGFDDIDQRKRYTFIFDTTNKNPLSTLHYFGTVSPDGKITGEPLPIKYVGNNTTEWNDNLLLKNKYLENGVVRWDLSPDENYPVLGEITDNNTNFVVPIIKDPTASNNWSYTNHPRLDNMCLLSELRVENGKFIITMPKRYTDKATFTKRYITPYPYDLGVIWNLKESDIKDTTNIFPTRYIFTNQTENKNKYWSYGIGWSKYLSFEYQLHVGSKIVDILTKPLSIIEGDKISIADALGRNIPLDIPSTFIGNEDAKAGWIKFTGSTEYLRCHKFPVEDKEEVSSIKSTKEWLPMCHNIGGDNSKNWLFSIPFTSNVSKIDELGITSQIYQGLTVSYGAQKSLLSTPSDENSRSIWFYKDESGTEPVYIFVDGYSIFEIEKETVVGKYDKLKVQKIADYCYKFNILDGKNFLKESSDGAFDFLQAFSRYNMDSIWNIEKLSLNFPIEGEDTNDIFFFASAFNQELFEVDPISTFLYPSIQIPFILKPEDKIDFDNIVMKLKNPILIVNPKEYFVDDEYFVDVYYNHTLYGTELAYRYTNYADENNTKFFDSNKDGFIWSTSSDFIIFPIGMGSIIESTNFITPTVKLSNDYSVRLYNKNNQTFIVFNTLARIYKGEDIFTIYGGNYVYSGQAIYYVGSANDYSQSQFVCYSLGLKFLANSGTEAYFYSPWEKRLFIFTGSNTLQAADSFAALGDVKGSLFSSNEQALYILFESLTDKTKNVLYFRTQADSGAILVDAKNHLESTEKGAAFIYDDLGLLSSTYNVISPYIGESLPFRLSTEFIGDSSMMFRFPSIDILLYGKNKTLNFTIKFKVLNGINTKEEIRKVELRESDWKADNYRYSFNPANMTGNSFKLSVESEDDIYISFMSVAVDDLAPANSAPISRSGSVTK